MALKGRAGQRFSQAPQPMQRSSFMTGTCGESAIEGSEGTIVIAPVGQWRAAVAAPPPPAGGGEEKKKKKPPLYPSKS